MTQNELAVIPGKPPATVTQEELRRVGELWNESEALAASIRKRLEAGASLEPGDLGVAIDAVTGPGGGGGSIFIGGIQVDAADHLPPTPHRAPRACVRGVGLALPPVENIPGMTNAIPG